MVNKKFKKKKGLTLLELVIVLGLMGIITYLVFSFVNLTQRKSLELDIRQKLQHQGTMITESMMDNLLQAKSIFNVEKDSTTNNLKEITFNLVGPSELKGKNAFTDIVKIKYKVDRNKLELLAIKKDEDVTDSSKWKKVQTISENIQKVELTNKNLLTEYSYDEDKLKNEKNVGLKITLEKDYYNKKIEYGHVMELNLRNAR